MAESPKTGDELGVPVVDGLGEETSPNVPIPGVGGGIARAPQSLSLAFAKTADFLRKEAKEIVQDIRALTVDDRIALPVMVFFGDSLTEYGMKRDGWITKLGFDYEHKVDLLCRGARGYNSRWGKFLIPRFVGGLNPKLVRVATVFFGTNDATREGSEQHIGLAEYRSNLYTIGRFLMEQLGGSSVSDRLLLILITPPPVDEEAIAARRRDDQEPEQGMVGQQVLRRSNAVMEAYAMACCEVAAALRVSSLNLFEGMQEEGVKYQELLDDGVHLNAKGNDFVKERLAAVIRAARPGLAAEALRDPAVPWRSCDPKLLSPSAVPLVASSMPP